MLQLLPLSQLNGGSRETQKNALCPPVVSANYTRFGNGYALSRYLCQVQRCVFAVIVRWFGVPCLVDVISITGIYSLYIGL